MVLPPPFGSEEARRRRRGVSGGGKEEDEMREVAATGYRTVNLVSTDSWQVQGRTVAPVLHSSSLCPVRPAIATPFTSNCRQTLGTSRLSLSRRSVLRGMDGWMVWEARHAQLFAYTPFLPSPCSLRLSCVGEGAFLSDYSPSERRANNNPAMTCSLADHLRSSSCFQEKGKKVRDASNECPI